MNIAVALRKAPLIKLIRNAADIFERDRIALYSAQASYCIVVSSIPVAMLIISLAQYVLPVSVKTVIEDALSLLPAALLPPVRAIIDELFSRPPLTLVSITAAAALWSASRGVDAVGRGLRTIYRTHSECGIVCAAVGSVLNALLFIAMFLSMLVLIVFGRALVVLVDGHYPALSHVTGFFYRIRGLFFLTVLSLFFTVVYCAYSNARKPVLRRKRAAYCRVSDVRKPRASDKSERAYGFAANLPGAVLAAAGWVVFSYCYAIFMENYAFGGSYIYGSLSAIVLLLLWLYFCMMIFLAGAEFNRFLVKFKQKYDIRSPSVTQTAK